MGAFHAVEDLEPLLKIFYRFGGTKVPENYRQIYGKSKESLWGNLSTSFFRTILCFLALVYNCFLFRTAVLRKLYDLRFSYKHCNFSRVCLLVKMASKTVTRSILAVSDITTTVYTLTHRWQRRKKTNCLLYFRVLNLKISPI